MVHQIFAEKPHVQRAFQANVPTRIMTHNQFWAKYLRHQLLQQVRRAPVAAATQGFYLLPCHHTQFETMQM